VIDQQTDRGAIIIAFGLTAASGALIGALLMWLVTSASAAPLPTPKHGSCPSGYVQSGSYCAPASSTREKAIPKVGQCPSGWFQSGSYCKEMPR
jgi:hypothetical protein